jgi:hypothetical protein
MRRIRTETRRQFVESTAARRLQAIDQEIDTILRAFPVLRSLNRAATTVLSPPRARPRERREGREALSRGTTRTKWLERAAIVAARRQR